MLRCSNTHPHLRTPSPHAKSKTLLCSAIALKKQHLNNMLFRYSTHNNINYGHTFYPHSFRVLSLAESVVIGLPTRAAIGQIELAAFAFGVVKWQSKSRTIASPANRSAGRVHHVRVPLALTRAFLFISQSFGRLDYRWDRNGLLQKIV